MSDNLFEKLNKITRGNIGDLEMVVDGMKNHTTDNVSEELITSFMSKKEEGLTKIMSRPSFNLKFKEFIDYSSGRYEVYEIDSGTESSKIIGLKKRKVRPYIYIECKFGAEAEKKDGYEVRGRTRAYGVGLDIEDNLKLRGGETLEIKHAEGGVPMIEIDDREKRIKLGEIDAEGYILAWKTMKIIESVHRLTPKKYVMVFRFGIESLREKFTNYLYGPYKVAYEGRDLGGFSKIKFAAEFGIPVSKINEIINSYPLTADKKPIKGDGMINLMFPEN